MCEIAAPAFEDISPNPCTQAYDAESSLKTALSSVGAPLDGELHDFFTQYCLRKHEQKLFALDDQEVFRRLMYEDRAFKIGSKLSDLIDLLRIVAPETEPYLMMADAFRHALNRGLLGVSPGLSLLNAHNLLKHYKGDGIKIAIFDVFDKAVLQMQREHYRGARMSEVVDFGRPVRLAHGNIVIDIILSIAPNAELVLVSSDSVSTSLAIEYLLKRPDVQIVNQSRALKSGTNAQMELLTKEKIVVKALGNSGTDLMGQVSAARAALGLGPTGDFSSYDATLIREFLENLSDDNLILAQNWTLDGNSVALSSTIAGDNVAAQSRIACVTAEAVFSLSSDNFESGSSFAAPQVSALAALLLEAQNKSHAPIDLPFIATLLRDPNRLLNADEALARIASQR